MKRRCIKAIYILLDTRHFSVYYVLFNLNLWLVVGYSGFLLAYTFKNRFRDSRTYVGCSANLRWIIDLDDMVTLQEE